MADISIDVFRGGLTSDYMSAVDKPDANIHAGYPHNGSDRKAGGFSISLYLPSKGGGTTKVHTWVPPSMFEKIAMTMIEGSPKEAEKAFLKALLAGAESSA